MSSLPSLPSVACDQCRWTGVLPPNSQPLSPIHSFPDMLHRLYWSICGASPSSYTHQSPLISKLKIPMCGQPVFLPHVCRYSMFLQHCNWLTIDCGTWKQVPPSKLWTFNKIHLTTPGSACIAPHTHLLIGDWIEWFNYEIYSTPSDHLAFLNVTLY